MAKLRQPGYLPLNDASPRSSFKVTFYQKDIFTILGYGCRIQKMVDRGDKVPARVLAKWFSFFEKPKLADLMMRGVLLEKRRKHAISKLIPRYDFNIYVRTKSIETAYPQDLFRIHQLPAKKGITAITLAVITQLFFDSLAIEPKFNTITTDKNKFVKYAYKFLWSYLKMAPVRKRPKLYSQSVIVGYLAVEFNLLDNEEAFALNKHTNTRHYPEYLHEKTIYICKKITT